MIQYDCKAAKLQNRRKKFLLCATSVLQSISAINICALRVVFTLMIPGCAITSETLLDGVCFNHNKWHDFVDAAINARCAAKLKLYPVVHPIRMPIILLSIAQKILFPKQNKYIE